MKLRAGKAIQIFHMGGNYQTAGAIITASRVGISQKLESGARAGYQTLILLDHIVLIFNIVTNVLSAQHLLPYMCTNHSTPVPFGIHLSPTS